MLAGKPRDFVAKVAEANDGTFHYDLSRDVGDGARFSRTSISSDAYGLEDDPVELNMDFTEANINADAKISEASTRAMDQHGLAGRVDVGMVGGLIGELGGDISGRQRRGEISLNQASGDIPGTLRHEFIHALRPVLTKRGVGCTCQGGPAR